MSNAVMGNKRIGKTRVWRACVASSGGPKPSPGSGEDRSKEICSTRAETRQLRLDGEQNVLILILFAKSVVSFLPPSSPSSKMSLIARTSRALPSHSQAFIVASSSASTSVPTLKTALQHRRTLATPTGPAKPYHHEKPPPPPPTWLTVQLRKNPLAMKLFLNMMSVFGYGSVKQIAARRALNIYDQHCSGKAEEEMEFWRDGEFYLVLRNSGGRFCKCTHAR